MNAPSTFTGVAVREADLRDAGECARIAGFVVDHGSGTPFHLPAWSMAVAEGCGHRACYLVAERADGALAGVLPLTFVRSMLFGRALVSSGFAVGGGCLAHDPATVRSLAEAAWALSRRLDCGGIELRGGPAPGPDWISDDAAYLGFARDLAADDEAELLAIPRKQRAEVRKALANDLTIATGEGERGDHYRVYATSVRNLGTPVFPRALFARVLDRFGAAADILTVRHQDVAVASVLSLFWGGTVYPYWGGGTDAARGLRANDAMYFALMHDARARGCTRFDFGRSKAGTGAASFKKNWGFVGVPLVYHHRTASGERPRAINPLDPKYAAKIAAWKRLPLPIANWIGPLVARGLA
jgi:FemAB-related protein (PEP-CTERM system-associated)